MEFSENKLKHVITANLMIDFLSKNERRIVQSSLIHEKLITNIGKESDKIKIEEILSEDKLISDYFNKSYEENLDTLIAQLKKINDEIV